MGVDTLPVLMVSNQLLWGVGWLRDINDFDKVGMLQMLLQRMAEEVQGVQGGVGERETKGSTLVGGFVDYMYHT